jgi:hypothetical protein
MSEAPCILCLNSGSSSLKFALYELGAAESRLATGAVERIGLPSGRLWIRDGEQRPLTDTPGAFADARAAVHATFAAAVMLSAAKATVRPASVLMPRMTALASAGALPFEAERGAQAPEIKPRALREPTLVVLELLQERAGREPHS